MNELTHAQVVRAWVLYVYNVDGETIVKAAGIPVSEWEANYARLAASPIAWFSNLPRAAQQLTVTAALHAYQAEVTS